MPKKIKLEDIKEQLPAFVSIVDSSYRGARYNAKFIDTDYNEEFEAIPCSVIRLQHGCKSRSNQRRADATGYNGPHATPIEEIKAALPDYLEIDETTYKSKREQATFRDKELNVTFNAYVCNVIRDGKGYCKEKRLAKFKELVSIPIEEIEKRLLELYGNRISLIKETYIDTQATTSFRNNQTGKIFRNSMVSMLAGTYFLRRERDQWRKTIKQRDNFTCQVCESKNNLVTHHIFSWTGFEERRFDLNNGITLCSKCHNEFHSIYDKGNNTLIQFKDYLNKKSERLSSLANELEVRFTSEPRLLSVSEPSGQLELSPCGVFHP